MAARLQEFSHSCMTKNTSFMVEILQGKIIEIRSNHVHYHSSRGYIPVAGLDDPAFGPVSMVTTTC